LRVCYLIFNAIPIWGWGGGSIFSKMVPADLIDSTCGAGTSCYYFGASDLSGWLAALFFPGLPLFFDRVHLFFSEARDTTSAN
jgi:Zn-dependent protease